MKIIVWGVSELTDSSGYIEGAPAPGTVVQSDGSIFFPYIGIVDVGGKTIPKIREDLTERLGTYFPDPQVEVRILEFNSQSAVVAGAVSAPARYALGATPTRLLDLLALARHDQESADLNGVVLHRGSRSYTVNLKDYLERGRDAANPLIVDGDTVFVPEQEQLEAFVLGEIERASSIDITQREVNLTQILSEAGGLTLQDADARGIFVFRRDQSGVTVFQLDVSNPSAYLLGTQFIIRAKDVVYVTTDPVSRWNRLISDLLPSVGLYQTAQDI